MRDRAAAPGPVSTSVVVSDRQFNIPQEVSNDCTGEDFITQGSGFVLISVTNDRAGGFHLNLHFEFTDFTFTNTATGATFHANQTQNISQQATPGGAPVNVEITFNLAGPGGRAVTNEVAHLRSQFIVNANGTVTVSNFEIRLSCS